MKPGITRILLADDNPAIRSALTLLLETRLNVHIVGVADSTEALLPIVTRLQPDLVILDWELVGKPEKDLVAQLHALSPSLKVVLTSSRPEVALQAQAVQADSYVCKSQPPEQVVHVIQTIMDLP
jgi:two-component system, NarL family, response regulator DesR